jgi:polysaccharide export outer membrane protein
MVFTPQLQRLLLSLAALFLISSNAALAQQAERQQPDVSYRLHKGDKLSIKFLYHPELNEPAAVVRPDGFITLQMIDDVKVEGLTAAELKQKLEQAYNESLLNPVISVSILEFVVPRVFVGGQVAKPGSYTLREGQTVFQAIMLAGGFTPEAHRKMVLHARPTGNHELKVTELDLLELMSRKSGARDELLQDGDYIFVPDSKLSKFSRVVDAFRFVVPGFAIR